MNFRSLAAASAVVSLLFGLTFCLIPGPVLPLYRQGLNLGAPDAQHLTLARSFGVALLMTAATIWGMRGLIETAVQRVIARYVALAMIVGAVVHLYAVVTAAVNAVGWSSVAVFVVFAVLWGRCGWAR